MDTVFLRVTPSDPEKDVIKKAADCIKSGGLVIFPTETVYGLGADVFNPEAVKNIYKAKGRPSDNPLIAHIAEPSWVERLAREVPDGAYKLMDAFWGGPLTIILKKREGVPDAVTAGLDTVAIRMPSNSTANLLIRMADTPIAAPSANLSGSPSPTTFMHAKSDMDGRVDMIIDGGNADIGVESTVVDMTGQTPVILRPGAVTREDVASVCGDCIYGGEYSDAPKCPGMKYTHYSPKANVFAVKDFENFALPESAEAGRTAVINYDMYKTDGVLFYSAGNDDFDYAARLFYLLRKADEDKIDTVYAALPKDEGIGTAIRNRLLKSAGGKVI